MSAAVRRRLRRLYRRAVFRFSLAFARAATRAGSRTLRTAARCAGAALYHLRPLETRRDLANLEHALGPLPLRVRRRILRASLVSGAETSLEFLAMISGALPPAAFTSGLTGKGLEELDRALGAGRGVIAVSLHLGAFTTAPLWLEQRGHAVSVVIREARHVPPGFYVRAIERLGLEPIPVLDSAAATRGVLDALRRGRVVFIYLDQGMKEGGVEVEFLGKRVPMPAGPVVLARRSGAPVLPVFLDPDARRVEVHPPLALEGGSGVAVTACNVAAMSRLAEAMVRRHPGHWHWRYRRWRRAPLPAPVAGLPGGDDAAPLPEPRPRHDAMPLGDGKPLDGRSP